MAAIEVVDVSLTEIVSERLRGRCLRAVPATNAAHTIEITGWVLGRECPAVAVELVNKCNVCLRAPINIASPDAAAIYSGVTEAAYSGFNLNMSVLGLTPEIEFLVQAVLKDQSRIPIGVIRARRLWHHGGVDANPPLVSVVIPCYHQARFVEEAIESVLAQSYPHFEVVLVDDGSSDNTAAIAGTYPGLRYIRQENAGLSAARNTGLRHSLGKYLVFLDADDRLLPTALEAGLKCFADHPESAFVYGHSRFVTFDGSPMRDRQPVRVEEDYYLALLRNCPIAAPASVMYRREIFEVVGGFDTSLSPAADYALYYCVARQFPIRCHEQTIVEYRRHDTNMTRRFEQMLRYNLAALRTQQRYVRRRPERREAYEAGIRFWKHAHGHLIVKGVRASIGAKQWKRATEGLWALLRFCPSYLPLIMGDQPLRQKIQDRIKRVVDKTMFRQPGGGVQLPLLQQIRQAVLPIISLHAKVIVVDKGDGSVLGLGDLQEWHFPPAEGLPERLFAAGSCGSTEVAWMQPGKTYNFRLYADRKRRKLLAAVSLMGEEGAAIKATPKPASIGERAAATTIAWETDGDLEAQVYVSESQAHAGYYPIDSREAIALLEGLRAKGAQYLLFPRTAFWWLEHYPQFAQHLESRHRVTVSREETKDACIIFDLCNAPHEHARLPDRAEAGETTGPLESGAPDPARSETTPNLLSPGEEARSGPA
jgi:glycosyltransferase involved in cell wall biosynthesis